MKTDNNFDKIKSWPFQEAKRILEKINYKTPEKGFVLFETGYGPSGLPHIGTFGEVVRISYVAFAFSLLAPKIPYKILVVSDDVDGMRKIPGNIPKQEEMKKYLGLPLTSVPDPFEEYPSFGEHGNGKLIEFLNRFNFKYEFLSATKAYKSGLFNEALKASAKKNKELLDLMLPTLGEERQATYNPFMPIDPDTGIVVADGNVEIDAENCILHYTFQGKRKQVSFLNGGCKLQWKCDFGMRWAALDVDYEMYGKDHWPNNDLYRNIAKTIGNRCPVTYFYELFLDEEGKKISKTKGNGIDINQWLRYTNKDVIAYYMYIKPQTAKKMSFDVIPKIADEYLISLGKYYQQTEEQQYENPVFYIHQGNIPKLESNISFGLILQLASICGAENEEILWKFLTKYDSNLKRNDQVLANLISGGVNYYHDFIKNNKINYEIENENIRNAILKFTESLKNLQDSSAEAIQNTAYETGKAFEIELQEWFSILYKILTGIERGPRIGTLISIYGVHSVIEILEKKLAKN